MRKALRDNGLSLVLLTFFSLFWFGQAVTGFRVSRNQAAAHGASPLSFSQYLRSAHFLEATLENWESEFLQMSAYVVFTAFLYQRGSAESKDPDERESADEASSEGPRNSACPRPVRWGGWRLKLYEHSLSGSLFFLFAICWMGHAWAGRAVYNADAVQHGSPPLSVGDYLVSSRFWFESLQNWQSEFASVAAVVLLSIWLRERGSPESKPVSAPHSATGK